MQRAAGRRIIEAFSGAANLLCCDALEARQRQITHPTKNKEQGT
jgi:hypothetical protein